MHECDDWHDGECSRCERERERLDALRPDGWQLVGYRTNADGTRGTVSFVLPESASFDAAFVSQLADSMQAELPEVEAWLILPPDADRVDDDAGLDD